MKEIMSVYNNTIEVDTIPDFLAQAEERFSSKIAVKINSRGTILQKTYLQLRNDANALNVFLRSLCVKNETVAIIGELSYEWIVAYFGVIGSGNIVVPIDKELNDAEIVKLLQKADVTILFYDENSLDMVKDIKSKCSNIRFFTFKQVHSLMNAYEASQITDSFIPYNIQPDNIAMIVFTTGSAGDSKGVMLSNRNICHNVICAAYLLGFDTLKSGETTVPILPMHHMLAINQLLTLMLFYGVSICIGKGRGDFFKNLKQFNSYSADVA